MKEFIIKNKLEIKKYFTLLVANFCLALALSGFVAYGNIIENEKPIVFYFEEHEATI